MISICKNEWLNPEYIEGMEISSEGLKLYMSSGRVLFIIDDVIGITKQIEDYWGKKMGAIVEEPKVKRKYTKRKKENDGEITNLGGE